MKLVQLGISLGFEWLGSMVQLTWLVVMIEFMHHDASTVMHGKYALVKLMQTSWLSVVGQVHWNGWS